MIALLLMILCANDLGHSTQLQPTGVVVAGGKSFAAHGLLVQSSQHLETMTIKQKQKM